MKEEAMQVQWWIRGRGERQAQKAAIPGPDAPAQAKELMPVGRRGVLRALSAAALAAAGATLTGAGRPEKADATGPEGPTVFTSVDATTAAEGDNTFASPPGGIGIKGTNSSDFFGAVEGHNSGGGGGFFGTTANPPNAAIEGDHLGFGIGLLGRTSSSANGNPGVAGVNGGAGGPGVVGYSTGTSSVGSGGDTDEGYGVYGNASGSGTGVLGASGGNAAVWGAASAAGAYSGLFTGGKGVIVYGALTVAGGPKSAAVKGADGTLRRLYCIESPESWFEDFGTAQLSGGSATVPLEPGFAGVMKADQYRVFPVANGDCKGLYVSNKTATSFTVHELQAGTSNVSFDYRVVAKRKDDAGTRLEVVEEPVAIARGQESQPPTLPSAPPARKRRG
jgi:hypothetical protein